MVEAIVSIDDKGTIVEFSTESERIFGYKADDIVGKNLTEHLIPPRFQKAHTEGFSRFLQHGNGKLLDTEQPIRLTLMGADQNEIQVRFHMKVILNGQKTIYRSTVQTVEQ